MRIVTITKHDERKMPKNLGHIESLARSYTRTAIKTLAGIMMEPNCPPMARVAAAKAGSLTKIQRRPSS